MYPAALGISLSRMLRGAAVAWKCAGCTWGAQAAIGVATQGFWTPTESGRQRQQLLVKGHKGVGCRDTRIRERTAALSLGSLLQPVTTPHHKGWLPAATDSSAHVFRGRSFATSTAASASNSCCVPAGNRGCRRGLLSPTNTAASLAFVQHLTKTTVRHFSPAAHEVPRLVPAGPTRSAPFLSSSISTPSLCERTPSCNYQLTSDNSRCPSCSPRTTARSAPSAAASSTCS